MKSPENQKTKITKEKWDRKIHIGYVIILFIGMLVTCFQTWDEQYMKLFHFCQVRWDDNFCQKDWKP